MKVRVNGEDIVLLHAHADDEKASFVAWIGASAVTWSNQDDC